VPERRGPTSPRLLAALAAVALVGLGLAVSRLDGPLADPAGDAVYAAFVYALVVVVAPRTRWAAVAAFAVCVLVELAQLTGLPARVVDAVPVARYALGTTFAAVDLVAYAVGVGAAALVRRTVAVPG
jgi:hypothetical protein